MYILSFNKISFDKTSFNKILRNETTFYGLDRFYINLLLKSCQPRKAKVALSCWYYKELLKTLKVAHKLPSTIYLCLTRGVTPGKRNPDSGILQIFACGIWNPGFWNPEYSSSFNLIIVWWRTSLRTRPRRNWEFRKSAEKWKHDQESFQWHENISALLVFSKQRKRRSFGFTCWWRWLLISKVLFSTEQILQG